MEESRLSPLHNIFYVIGLSIIGIAISLLSIFAYRLYQHSRIWDPLGDYPIQIVKSSENSLPNNEDNIINKSTDVLLYRNKALSVTGIKCVKAPGKVNVRGTIAWVSDSPGGFILGKDFAAGSRGPGCQQRTFINEIPKDVYEEIIRLGKMGISQSVWHLTGTETPIKTNGEKGESRTWVTTSFTIINKDMV